VSAPVLRVSGLGKSFRVPRHGGADTLKERVLHPFSGSGYEDLAALHDIDFEVGRGEFFAVIGRNGSGKSTLLKCIAGIYQPDAGESRVEGRIAPLIELGVGFNPELGARDNVLVNATMMGLSPSQAMERFDAIIEFAELEEFTELKLRNYSTGMRMRLGFATAIQVDAEVLLVDEVLAVGDSGFQRKCLETFRELKERGRTIILVSHTPGFVQLADRVLLLDDGELAAVGEASDVWVEYQRRSRARALETAASEDGVVRLGDGSAEVLGAWLENGAGIRTTRLERGGTIRVAVRAMFKADHQDPVIGFYVTGENRILVMHSNSALDDTPVGPVRAGETRTLVTSFENWLGGGFYSLSPYVAHPDGREAEIANGLVSFEVEAELVLGSVLDPPRETRMLAE